MEAYDVVIHDGTSFDGSGVAPFTGAGIERRYFECRQAQVDRRA